MQHGVDRGVVAEMVIIVQDDDQLLFDAFEDFIQEYVGRALCLLPQILRLLQKSEHGFAKAGNLLLNAVSEIAKKHRRVGISVIQLIPDERTLLFAQEVRDQGRLSRTGVGGDQGYWQGEVSAQSFNQ